MSVVLNFVPVMGGDDLFLEFHEIGTTNKYLIWGYLLLAVIVILRLVLKRDIEDKLLLFFALFFLLTGNYNSILAFHIPGISFFEIKPNRFLFILFSLFLVKSLILPSPKRPLQTNWKIPWFFLALLLFVSWIFISQFANVNQVGVTNFVEESMNALAFVVIIIAVRHFSSPQTIALIGKVILLAAVASSIISLTQIIFPYFMRMGDLRSAFGDTLRANGMFRTEYYNAYFMILGIAWTLRNITSAQLRIGIVVLLSLGVLSTFQRMSWLILSVVMLIYVLFLNRPIRRFIPLGVVATALLMIVALFYYNSFKNSSLVQDRLSDSIEGRYGYYSMVTDNIGQRPIFGFGGTNNEVYYQGMLQVTGMRERATGEAGDIHSGYFSSLFYYGLPGLLFFLAFTVLAIWYFARLLSFDSFFMIPLFIAILFAVANLTNTLLFSKYLAVVYAIHLGIGLGMRDRISEASSFKKDADLSDVRNADGYIY
ncbi:MAG: O-antigen ligase family protein [Saprospiraceae bacterium]|nr:O-antigen ligase family protein [Saprospiraceae bacterium]